MCCVFLILCEYVVLYVFEFVFECVCVDEDDKVYARRLRVFVRAKRVSNSLFY